jgi:hypothetical protein
VPDLSVDDTALRVQGAFSLPLAYAYGFQADGALAQVQGQTFSHVAAHLFWRNPLQGLAGAYASYSTWGGFNRARAAFEGEAYFGSISLEALVGIESGNLPSGSGGLFTITDLAVYPTADLRLSAGLRHNAATTALAAGAELQFASGRSGGWAGYVEAESGSNNYQKVFAGVRLYFGKDKSLVRRHREDDPRVKADEGSLIGCVGGASVGDGALAIDSGLGSQCGAFVFDETPQ